MRNIFSSTFYPGLTPLLDSQLLSPSGHTGNEGSIQCVTVPLSFLALTVFPCSNVGCLPWDSPSATVPAWALPTGYSPSEIDCCSMGPPWATTSATILLLGFHTGSSGYLLCPGLPWAAGRQHASPWVFTCRGISAPMPGAPSPFFSDLDVCWAAPFAVSHSSLTAAVQCFFTLFQICYHKGTTSVIDLFRFGQQWVFWSQHRTSPCPFSERLPNQHLLQPKL